MSLVGSDAPTFSIAETTRTNHFSLLLRKLPNRNLPEFSWTEPTLNSMLILNVVNTDKNFITVLIFKVQALWYSFDQYMQFYTLIKWVLWILRIHVIASKLTNVSNVLKFTKAMLWYYCFENKTDDSQPIGSFSPLGGKQSDWFLVIEWALTWLVRNGIANSHWFLTIEWTLKVE